jgi:hypothetical protein
VTHFRKHPVYTWKIVKDSISHSDTVIAFDMAREYSEKFVELAGENLSDFEVTISCTITLIHNGFFNFLAEEKSKKR